MILEPKVNARRLVLLFWLLVATFYFYVSFDYIRTEMNDTKLGEYVHYVVQLAGAENRSPREVRALLLIRADELGLPLRSDQIKVLGIGQQMKISLAYDIDLDIPIFRRGFYSKHYAHEDNYRQGR